MSTITSTPWVSLGKSTSCHLRLKDPRTDCLEANYNTLKSDFHPWFTHMTAIDFVVSYSLMYVYADTHCYSDSDVIFCCSSEALVRGEMAR